MEQNCERYDLYFAYGSNMNVAQMQRRCGQAVKQGAGYIAGWDFRIMERGYATIVPQAGGVVWGGLWSVLSADERALDRYEGVGSGFYRRSRVSVWTPTGEVDALVYIARDAGRGSANDGYMEAVIAGARSFQLPRDYVAMLEEVN